MNKMWLVAKYEYLTNIRKRSFLFAAFGIPSMILVVWLIIFAVEANQETRLEDFSQVGYVDQADVIQDSVEAPDSFSAYGTEEDARRDLDAETISVYFVIPENYMPTGKIQLYAYGTTPEALSDIIHDFMLANIAATIEADAPLARLQTPVEMQLMLLDSGRVLEEEAIAGIILTPMLFMMVFLMATQITSGFLMGGVVEEKSNRIMEILITSITPLQMLMGKLLGLGALGLTQMGIWLAMGIGLSQFRGDNPFLAGISIPPDLIVLLLIYFILSYFLTSSIMAGVGAVIGSEQESRQYVSVFAILLVIPFIFILQFLQDPNGTLPTILSLIPFTAGISMIMRVSFSSVPLEQIVLSIGLLLVTTIFITWAAAKVFRWSLLLYGKRPSPRELFRVIRGSVDMDTVPGKPTQEAS